MVGEDMEVLKMSGGGSCTTFMPLNCTLKMVKMVHFVRYILPQ